MSVNVTLRNGRGLATPARYDQAMGYTEHSFLYHHISGSARNRWGARRRFARATEWMLTKLGCVDGGLVDDLETEELFNMAVASSTDVAALDESVATTYGTYLDGVFVPRGFHHNPDAFEDNDDCVNEGESWPVGELTGPEDSGTESDDTPRLGDAPDVVVNPRQMGVRRKLPVSARVVASVHTAIIAKVGYLDDCAASRLIVSKVARQVMKENGFRDKIIRVHLQPVINSYFCNREETMLYGGRRRRCPMWLLRLLGFRVGESRNE